MGAEKASVSLPMAPSIHVVLPVYERVSITEQCVRCLQRQSVQSWHLLLIDDGPSGATSAMVQKYVPEATVIRGNGKWWWGGALHQAYLWFVAHPKCKDDILVILNDDTTFEDDFLETAVRELRACKRTLLLAQSYSQTTKDLLDNGVSVDWRRLRFTSPVSTDQVTCFSTRGLFMKVRNFLEIGGFYPFLLPHYGSDYEFTMRAHRKGMNLVSTPSVKLWANEKTTGYHELSERSVWQFLNKTLSKKSAANPVYWTTFIFLACPVRWIPLNLLRVWGHFQLEILRTAVRGLSSFRDLLA